MNTMGKIIRGPCVYKPAKWDSAHLSGALNDCFLSNICSEKQIKPRIYFYLRTAHYQANITPNFHGLFCQQRKWFNVENDLSSSAVEVLAINSFQTSSCCVFQARYKLHQQNLSNGLAHPHSFLIRHCYWKFVLRNIKRKLRFSRGECLIPGAYDPQAPHARRISIVNLDKNTTLGTPLCKNAGYASRYY